MDRGLAGRTSAGLIVTPRLMCGMLRARTTSGGAAIGAAVGEGRTSAASALMIAVSHAQNIRTSLIAGAVCLVMFGMTFVAAVIYVS